MIGLLVLTIWLASIAAEPGVLHGQCAGGAGRRDSASSRQGRSGYWSE
jgi:hypothetical protein